MALEKTQVFNSKIMLQMSKLLNMIPVVLRVLILICASIALGISLFWAYTEPNNTEPKLAVVTSVITILIFGSDIYSQINPSQPQSPNTTNSVTQLNHSGTGDNIAGDKVQGDKVQGNKIQK